MSRFRIVALSVFLNLLASASQWWLWCAQSAGAQAVQFQYQTAFIQTAAV